MDESFSWRIYNSLILGSNTFMVKSLREKYSCISPTTIKVVNAKWITNKSLSIISVNPNISNEALNTIL
jgi:hypothetical protein